MEQAPDVVVIGASAAGLAAAWSAAGEGAHVRLLEAREAIGVPPASASLAFDFLWEAPFRPPASTVRRRHAGLRVRAPGGALVEVDAPLAILDRARFDQWLAKEAEARGATIETGAKPDLDALRGSVLVFADGARTLATRYLPSQRHPGSLAWGSVLAFEQPGAQEADRVTLTLGHHARGGRSQLNPLEGDAWTHWTFYRGEAADAEARAREALRIDARLSGWPVSLADEARFVGVAPDPVYTLPGRLSAPNVLVAGGAGGQGGLELGLGAGVMAGRVAARVATGHASPGDYERAWKREHLRGYRALRTATERLARLPDDEIDRLLAPWDGRRLDVNALKAPATTLARNPRALPALLRAAVRSIF